MSRQEDFIGAGIAYRMEHSKPMCIAGSNFADVERDLNRVISFEAGWKHYRIQAAIAAMQGQLANQVLTENMIESVENVDNFPKVVANASVRIADALIAELQKKQD